MLYTNHENDRRLLMYRWEAALRDRIAFLYRTDDHYHYLLAQADEAYQLMPAASWYEWNEKEPVKNSTGRAVNQPYYHHAIDGDVLATAGIWSTWSPPEGEPITSCALLTKEADGLVSAIHHRMPVILAPEQWKTWLSPDTSLELAYDTIALARQDFEAYRISTDVGSVRNQGAQLIEPI